MKLPFFFLLMINLLSCQQAEEQNVHQSPTHNFTVQRLLILNDQGEMLMTSQEQVWAPPSLLFDKRQHVKEGLDSLADAYGLQITPPQLRGQFSFKYDYHPYATIRNFYVARYVSGVVRTPVGMDDAQWIPIPEAIEQNTVTAIKDISAQIIKFPNAVWGGAFEVSHVGDSHPTIMTEKFYPMFMPDAASK